MVLGWLGFMLGRFGVLLGVWAICVGWLLWVFCVFVFGRFIWFFLVVACVSILGGVIGVWLLYFGWFWRLIVVLLLFGFFVLGGFCG